MEARNSAKEEGMELPLPPPVVPSNVAPIKVQNDHSLTEQLKKKRVPMARPGFAKKGQPISLLTNHFKVSIRNVDDFFFHYSVNLKYEDDRPVDGKGIGRKVIDKMQQTYDTELGKKGLVYDGEKTLFTIGPLPQINNEFTVILDDMPSKRNGSPNGNDSPSEGERKRARRSYNAKTIKVELSFAAKIPMQSISLAIQGKETENTQEALRVLDIILRQHAAKQGCLLVRQSFFHDKQSNYSDLGGGVFGCRGFHSSFRPVKGGLSLNVDVSTTMTVRPGPVVDFLIANQNVRDPFQIDWAKAKRMLKNLRVKVGNLEYKIVGLSDLPCDQQMFTLRQRGDSGDNALEITVYDYFVSHRGIPLNYSGRLPCINVGKPKRPTYFPIELCNLVSLQRYTKALTVLQRASLVEKSRQKPQERMSSLSNALKYSNYDADPMLQACGISINTNFTQVDGRVLPAPKLKVGNGEDFFPRNGRWNFNNKKLMQPAKVERWAVVNFSARCDISSLIRDLIKCGNMKGVLVEQPFDVFEENPSVRRATPPARVDEMFEQIRTKLPGVPKFLLCLLPERKNSDLYGPWKLKCLSEFGIVTQCIAPMRVNDQYLTNVLLKINAKLGGLNSLLQIENTSANPIISRAATIILGMDVCHGSPGRSDVPSIAAVVSSRQWPLISKYRASVRTQSSKVEMIDSLFKPSEKNEDDGIIRELLLDFYTSSGKKKPDQIIIFRDGVSESQFNQVLNIELDKIIEACKFLDEQWCPKFTLMIAQKNHHTKFFQAGGSPDNVPPGTVVDNQVCHPKNYDFYMCSHAGMIGTSRPTHYHVLLDENGFSPDDLQELVHSLSYVYQRSTTAISVVAPICYAHLAAAQIGQFTKFEDRSETSSSQGGFTAPGVVPVPELPRLHENVRSSMFFC
ncbi:protein argonaute 4B-like [Phalaenopsis equestris]|uniref:protein argonaute 4B-like n=1 Tax=Phalaenopsis equestris TaxID=78828 RepID=UPI0009E42156|nr:protein argonaute 4B-like [Phalaenopsis equestris]XP_020583524.1 protein argonaute 4B-like [Phalaenopsis equestris]